MTREQFNDLARRASAYAAAHPRLYRAKVALWAALGYAVFFGIMVLAIAVILGIGRSITSIGFWELVSREPRFGVLAVGIVLVMASLLFSMTRALFMRWPVPAGWSVCRKDAPALFALIDEVATATDVRAPKSVLFTAEFNAGVIQLPRFGWVGPSRDYVLLGLPLMAGLTPDEFKSVLAHEFAHLRRHHRHFRNWIWKLRETWQALGARFVRERRKFGLLFLKFGQWYAPRFNAYSFALSREHEFEADLCAASIGGKGAAATALVKIAVLGKRLDEEFWRPTNDLARKQSEPPVDVFAGLLSILRVSSTPEQRRRYLRQVIAAETEGADTHPSTIERLKRLGCLFSTALDASDAIDAFAAESSALRSASDIFLEQSHLKAIIAGLETNWRVAVGQWWRSRFEQAEELRTRLRSLDAKTQGTDRLLDENEEWERAAIQSELAESDEIRREILEKFIARRPENATAQYAQGSLLLANDDSSGIARIEKAIALDGRLAAQGEALIAAFLRRNGKWEEAAACKLESVRKADMLDNARSERHLVKAKDKFLSHGLSETDVAALREQLQLNPRVAKAWLAQKRLIHFPEHPWFVLVCAIRWRWYEMASRKKLLIIVRELAASLTIAGKKEFSIFVHGNHGRIPPISKAVRRVEDSEIYSAARRTKGSGRVVAAKSSTLISLPPPVPPAPAKAAFSVRESLPWGVVVASFFIIGLPLSYVGLQLKRSVHLWHIARAPVRSDVQISRRKDADAHKPIIIDPHSSRAQIENERALAWAERVMSIQHYGGDNSAKAAWAPAADGFIRAALRWWFATPDAPSAKNLLPAAQTLLGQGCDDPVVLFLAGKLKFATDMQSAEASELFNRSLEMFAKTKYPAAVARLATQAFIEDCERRNDGTGQSRAATKLWLKYFEKQLADGSYSQEEQSVLARQMCAGKAKDLFNDEATQCLAILNGTSAMSLAPWVQMLLAGKAHMELGWHARGSGYASTVTHEGWKEFFSQLQQARQQFTASWDANPERPEAAAEMIGVVMAERNTPPGESERLWFDRAVTAQFDYLPAYRSFAWSLRPRWSGSKEAMLDFGRECLQTRQFNTLVPLEFLYAVYFLRQEDDGGTAVFHDPQITAELDEMFSAYQDEKIIPSVRACVQRRHAHVASLVGNFALAYDLLRPLDFQLDPELVGSLDEGDTPNAFIERVAAFGGPAGRQILQAEQLVRKGKVESALVLFRESLPRLHDEPRAQHYVQSKISALELKRDLDTGEWVSFQPTPDSDLAGWTTVLGSWAIQADGSLVAHSKANGFLLVNDAAIGPNFEVRGEMEFLPGFNGEVQAGIAFGHPSWQTYDWRSVRLRRQPDQRSEVAIAQHWKAGPTRAAPTAEHNTFLLRCWRARMTFVLNGNTIFQDEPLTDGFIKGPDARVGLGAYAHHGNVFAVRYRNLELRRLQTAPSDFAKPAVLKTSNRR